MNNFGPQIQALWNGHINMQELYCIFICSTIGLWVDALRESYLGEIEDNQDHAAWEYREDGDLLGMFLSCWK